MLYRTIGGRRTVSALCLGTMNFGTSTDPDTAATILDRFVEAGGTFVDTANGVETPAGVKSCSGDG